MDAQTAFAKTDKGAEEIETRQHKLDHRLRALLLVVNGKNTVAQLMRDFARFGDVQAMLEKLLSEGFIKTERPFPEIRIDVASTIYAALGPDSNTITQEVEDCGSLEELRKYLLSRRSVFETALGKQRGDRLWAKLNALVA